MCDTVPGTLLLLHDARDPVAEYLVEMLRGGNLEGVGYEIDLRSSMARRGVADIDALPFRLHRLKVPEGEELWKLNSVFQSYDGIQLEGLGGAFGESLQGRFGEWFTVGRRIPFTLSQEHYLHLPAAALSADHQAYTKMVNLPPAGGERGRGTTISVIDSGLETGVLAPSATFNWVDDTAPNSAEDNLGHGTGVAMVLNDLAPDADIVVHKVSDRPRISEWAVLAAVASSVDADVVNMSLAFGLEDRVCSKCGRQSHGARSRVFETVLDAAMQKNPGLVAVAAAGNHGVAELAYPARFGDVVAVLAATSTGALATYSNRGTIDHLGQPHGAVFVAPGGDGGEYVVRTDTNGTTQLHTGTSFAAPYVSAMIALYRSGAGAGTSRQQVVAHLAAQAHVTVPGFGSQTHGNGLARY